MIRESNWCGLDVCVKCENKLNNSQKMNCNGVCPKCGNAASGTICTTMKVVLKKIKHHPWWRFWNKKLTYRGLDEYSKYWVNSTYPANKVIDDCEHGFDIKDVCNTKIDPVCKNGCGKKLSEIRNKMAIVTND